MYQSDNMETQIENMKNAVNLLEISWTYENNENLKMKHMNNNKNIYKQHMTHMTHMNIWQTIERALVVKHMQHEEDIMKQLKMSNLKNKHGESTNENNEAKWWGGVDYQTPFSSQGPFRGPINNQTPFSSQGPFRGPIDYQTPVSNQITQPTYIYIYIYMYIFPKP